MWRTPPVTSYMVSTLEEPLGPGDAKLIFPIGHLPEHH